MDNVHAADLPAFLDPLLTYLSKYIPSNLYDILITVLSHAIALISAAYTLAFSLSSWKPWEWDAQTILPPLITILAAYYALLNVYRTTGWMIRTSVWAMKWGTIISILFAGAGWMIGNNGGNVAEIVQQLFGSHGTRNAADSRRTGARRTGGSRSRRPRPWESFEAHRDWQYEQDERQNADVGNQYEMQSLAQQMMAMAMRTIGGINVDFLGAAKSFLDSMADSAAGNVGQEQRNDDDGSNGERGARATRKQPKRKAKTQAGRNRSR